MRLWRELNRESVACHTGQPKGNHNWNIKLQCTSERDFPSIELVIYCHNQILLIKPIFHQIFVGRVWVDNAIDCVLGTFQIIFHPPKVKFSKRVYIIMEQDPKCTSY